jgi:hypothetical protein
MAELAQFLDAVTRGNLAQVRAMLEADPTLASRTDADGATALHHAAFAAQHDVVDMLLAAGADLNARDGTHGATPGGWALHRLRERGALLAVEIADVAFALDRGDEGWVQRLVHRHPALKTARDHDGRLLAAHPRVRTSAALTALFAMEHPEVDR